MYKKILIAIENSDADRTVLEHVQQLATLTGASLLLVHVADGWVARNYDDLALRESQEMKEDRAYLATVQAQLVSAGVDRDRFTVDVRTEEDPVAAIAPDAFKQVLLNLVQNSREAQSSGQPAIERSASCATVLLSSSGEKVIIVVADDGPGIPAAVLPRIFDPFFTTKGEVHGVGLGLFVAQGLIRAVGGRLSVDIAAVGGARFHIELPLAISNDPRSALDA